MYSCDISRCHVMGSRGHCAKSHLVLDLSFWSCKVFQGRVTIRLKLVPIRHLGSYGCTFCVTVFDLLVTP
jgi:hypothetical protein